MDVVYIVKDNVNPITMKYSLRSLKHLKDLENVWIVGPKLIQFKNINFLEMEDLTDNKQENVILKLLKVCREKRLSENFILMNDDFFFLEDTKIEILKEGLLKDKIKRYKINSPLSKYTKALEDTESYLKSKGFKKIKNFEVHYPFIYNKKKFLEIFSNLENKKLLHRSIYGAFEKYDGTETEDFKVYSNFPKKYEKRFLSSADGIENSSTFIQFLKGKFPEKSQFDKICRFNYE